MQPWVDPTRSALILRRVSTEDQVDNYSWKSQLDLVDLARKDGFVDVQVFDEAGISGEELDNRPVAQRLLEQINSGTAGALYLLNWSRGSRDEDLIDGRLIMRACRQHNTLIRLPEGVFDMTKEADEDLADINFLFAKRFKREMIRNISRSEYRKAQEGRFVGGNPVFGYRYKYEMRETTRGARPMVDWEIDPAEARIVKWIHENYYRYSTYRWATILNRIVKFGWIMPFPIKAPKLQVKHGKTSREWHPNDVSNIIKNDMCIGRLEYATYNHRSFKSGKKKPSRYLRGSAPVMTVREDLRIISDELFENNIRLFHERGRSRTGKGWGINAYTGLLLCPFCGSPMHARGNRARRRWVTYTCREHNQLGNAGCRGASVSEQAAHALVMPVLVEVIRDYFSPAIIQRLRQSKTNNREASKLRSDLERLDREEANLMNFARQGAITVEQLKGENAKITCERADIQTRLARLQADETSALLRSDEYKKLSEINANVAETLEALCHRRKSVFNRLIRTIFAGVVIVQDPQAPPLPYQQHSKIPGRRVRRPKPCRIDHVVLNPDLEQWQSQYGVEMNLSVPVSNVTVLNGQATRLLSSTNWMCCAHIARKRTEILTRSSARTSPAS